MYSEIEIDRQNLTIMGVKFNSLRELENTANAIGSNMFEGFVPTKEIIQLYMDWKNSQISESDFLNLIYDAVQ
jgi:putative transcriptional regulator